MGSVSKSTSEKGVTRGWLPEIAGAGSTGLNGSGDSAAVPLDLSWPLDVIGHVTMQFPVYDFL